MHETEGRRFKLKINPLYKIISSLGELVAEPILKHLARKPDHTGEIWEQRMGHLPPWIKRAAPFDLWIHGVSVGEISVVHGIVDKVRKKKPETNIVVSSFTETGFARAEKIFEGTCRVIAYPLDLPQAVKRTVSVLKPKIYACVETELWPNMLSMVKEQGAKTLLLNARISPRSFNRYKRIRPVIYPLLRQFSRICAISGVHARRLEQLGADSSKLEITGNAKYELLLGKPDPDRAGMLRRRLGIPGNMKVLVFGSLRGREHQIITGVIKEIGQGRRDIYCVVAPRHPGKVEDVERSLETAGLKYHLLSDILNQEKRAEPYSTDVLLVDKIGFLFDLYGLSTCAFVGGSLEKKGGQNLMEPAAWAKPVLFGPYTFNFEDAATSLMEDGGGMEVKDADELLEKLKMLLENQNKCIRKGRTARKTLERLAGTAATRQAQRILEYL